MSDGHIRLRKKGSGKGEKDTWAIVLETKDAKTGARKRKWHTFKGGLKEARIERTRLLNELNNGTYVDADRTALPEYFDRWLKHVKPSVSPKTFERYTEIATKTLGPLLKDVTLAKLETERVDRALTEALTSGRRNGKGGLSPRTVHHARRILIKALNQAVTWKLIRENPARASTPPKIERKPMLAYDAAQTAELLDAFRPTRMFPAVLLAVMCGLRRGEIAALRWRNVDLGDNRRVLSIVESAEQTKDGVRYKPPKSGKARTVSLSAGVVAELKAHRARQAEERLRLGLGVDPDSFVLAQVDGSALQPRSMTHEWVRILGNTKLPRVRFHDLRHSHASQMLAAGIHPKVASERLGHSTVGITLDLYSHVMPGMQADAAEQVDALIRAAVKPKA